MVSSQNNSKEVIAKVESKRNAETTAEAIGNSTDPSAAIIPPHRGAVIDGKQKQYLDIIYPYCI